MKFAAAFALLLTLSLPPFAGEISPAVAGELVEQANKLRDATVEGNYTLIVDGMHPGVVEMLGGRDQALQTLENGMAQIQAQGFKIAEYSVAEPTGMFESTNERVVFLPTVMVLAGSEVSLRAKSYLVASSPREGGAWKFVDGAGFQDPSGLLKLFPGLPSDVPIPERSREVIEK